MNKKEFNNFATVVFQSIKTGIRMRMDEIDRKRNAINIESVVEDDIVRLVKEGKIKLDSIEPTAEAYVSEGELEAARVIFTLDPSRIPLPESTKKLIKKQYDLYKEWSKLHDMNYEIHTVFNEWRAMAYASGNLNKEPFPAEFWEFISPSLRKYMVKEGENDAD